jgi:hypothetical protein
VDLDGDGIGDILSGSWPGELYFFRGEGKGRFAAGQTIKDKAGNVIKPGSASTVFAFDWDGDDKLDLLAGNIDGAVQVYRNEGTAGKNAFGKPQPVTAGGQPVKVHGDSHPVAADWDGDGTFDLVVGSGDGGVVWYRNAGTRAEPKLQPARTLLRAPPPQQPGAKANKSGPHGTRAKVWVGDYNGDGVLDLLVGDFAVSQAEAPKLTDADRAAQKKAEARMQEVMKELQPYFDEVQKLAPRGAGADPKRQEEFQKQIQVLQKRYQKQLDAYREAQMVVSRFQPRSNYDGFVWLLAGQRKPAAQRR